MKRTTIAIALATGALAVPAVSLAAGDDDPATQTPSTTPVQQQEQQQPGDHDCPGGRTAAAPAIAAALLRCEHHVGPSATSARLAAKAVPASA